MTPKVSLFASAIRTELFEKFLASLKWEKIPFEVVFAGPAFPEDVAPYLEKYPFFKYIHTKNVKPAQCYEVSRRACIGELIHWTADDAVYKNDCIANAYNYWQELKDPKAILSIHSKENNIWLDMDNHRFTGFRLDTPLMAPLGLMDREWLERLGGIDRRYICGQYENDIVMRVVSNGGTVYHFPKDKPGGLPACGKIPLGNGQFLEKPFPEGYVVLDHYLVHGTDRAFALGYEQDRIVLQKSWGNNGEALYARTDKFEPYTFSDEEMLEESECNLPGTCTKPWV